MGRKSIVGKKCIFVGEKNVSWRGPQILADFRDKDLRGTELYARGGAAQPDEQASGVNEVVSQDRGLHPASKETRLPCQQLQQ